MGTVLDPGTSMRSAGATTPLPTLEWTPVYFVLSLLGFTAMVVLGDGQWKLAIFVGLPTLLLGSIPLASRLFARSSAKRTPVRIEGARPADKIRSNLDFSPVDGLNVNAGHLGGGATQIVQSSDLELYVMVLARDGLGVSKKFGSYAEAERWAQSFVQDPHAVDLAKEILFESMTKIRIVDPDVLLYTSDWLLEWRFEGWSSHAAQVQHLINGLGFVRERGSSLTYGKPSPLER